MNGYGDENPCCYFHPNEEIVGICSLCLKERLIILAAKQGNRHIPSSNGNRSSLTVLRRKPTITFLRVFTLRSFLHPLEPQPRKEADHADSDEVSITSLDDSFISIKFEDNGRASWDKKQVASYPISGGSGKSSDKYQTKESKGGRSMVEHAKPWGALRWRKRIGHLLQMARWKRSSKATVSHVGLAAKAEGAKGRKGWIRSLTRRRTTTTTTTTTTD